MQKSSVTVSQKNIHAILQQRRLRHVTGICIRNLTAFQQKEKVGGDTHLKVVSSKKVFFKILAPDSETEASERSTDVTFESEHIDFCSNPSWLGFDLCKTRQTVGTRLNLELWVKDDTNDEKVRILKWNWNLSRLRYISERLYHGDISFAANAMVLQISGSFYSFSECFSTDTPHGNCPHFNLDEEKVSCNVFSLRRMVTSKKSIALSKQRSVEYVSSCEKLLSDREIRTEQKNQMENVRTKIKTLKLLLKRESVMLETENQELENLQSETRAKETNLAERRSKVLQQRDRFNEVTDQLVISRQRTDLLCGQLSSRRIEVLSELAYIFPILPYTPPSGTKNTNSAKNQKQLQKQGQSFMICRIHLPEAESLNAKEDSKNAVAMGYVSQMLYMISYFLLIPLRYPLMLQGSQSSVIDNVLEKIQEKERIFPLYVKANKERFLFEYAVYLLNKNIGQMRYLLGIPTSDLRPTLYNLKTLLEHAVGVQQGRSLTVRLPSNTLSKSPTRKSSHSPKPVRKIESIPKLVAPDNAEMNGIPIPNVGLEEKVLDKSVELHNLRGELFGNQKKSKTMPVSPHRSTSPSTSHKRTPSSSSKTSAGSANYTAPDIGIIVTESADINATFLTGLEDLDRGPKAEKEVQKPLDIVAARNELFKTKSGRSVISMTKRHTYTMRTGRSASGESENYFSAKEQVFKTDDFSKTFAVNGITEANNQEQNQNGIPVPEHGFDSFPLKATDNISVPHQGPTPVVVSDDLDLC